MKFLALIPLLVALTPQNAQATQFLMDCQLHAPGGDLETSGGPPVNVFDAPNGPSRFSLADDLSLSVIDALKQPGWTAISQGLSLPIYVAAEHVSCPKWGDSEAICSIATTDGSPVPTFDSKSIDVGEWSYVPDASVPSGTLGRWIFGPDLVDGKTYVRLDLDGLNPDGWVRDETITCGMVAL